MHSKGSSMCHIFCGLTCVFLVVMYKSCFRLLFYQQMNVSKPNLISSNQLVVKVTQAWRGGVSTLYSPAALEALCRPSFRSHIGHIYAKKDSLYFCSVSYQKPLKSYELDQELLLPRHSVRKLQDIMLWNTRILLLGFIMGYPLSSPIQEAWYRG